MVKSFSLVLAGLLLGIIVGGLTVHRHHQKLWQSNFDSRREEFRQKIKGIGELSDSLPPRFLQQIIPQLHLTENEIAQQIESNPFYKQLSLEERSKFLEKVRRFRNRHIEMAVEKRKELNLQVPEEDLQRFHQIYFQLKMQNMKQVRERSNDFLKELENQSDQELLKEFKK